MNRPTFRASILITSLLAASAVSAGSDIVKCVDRDGRVTLTDGQCSEGIPTVVVPGSSDVPAGGSPGGPATAAPATNTGDTADTGADAPARPQPAVHGTPIERIVLTPAQLPPSSWRPQRPTQMFSRDAETLKAARLSLQAIDEAAAARHHNLAGLD